MALLSLADQLCFAGTATGLAIFLYLQCLVGKILSYLS